METVQVAVRIRPLVQSETNRGSRCCLLAEENQIQIGTDKAFTYNYVFDENVSQSTCYETAVKSLVKKLFKGLNVTILAYGQTGSGKTYSMGTCYNGTGEQGIIPRSIVDIFDTIEAKSDSYNFQVTVSFLELYNENLYDLLSTKSREQNIIDIREDNKGIKLPGLTEISVSNTESTLKCLFDGANGRATGATAMNATSSRSHAIFTVNIYMESKTDKGAATTAKFHLVDLAGSERSKKTKATGDRFKEGVNINKGLLALGNVISALGEEVQKSYISYRDSKLTRLLQDSLGGNSVTLMIACVSPADYNLEETISTLRYADRARRIKNKPIVNQDPNKAEIQRLNQLVNTLRMQLTGEGIHMTSEEIAAKEEKINQLEQKNRELNSALSLALADNTNMFERQLIIQSANDKLKIKLLELQETYNVTLSNISMTVGQNIDCPITIKDEIEKLHNMQTLISDLQTEQKKHEDEILTHEYQSRQAPSTDNGLTEKVIAEEQEKYTYKQLDMNRELQDLNAKLAIKEKLAKQMMSNNYMSDFIDYSQFTENEKKVISLEKEKNELMQQLKQVQHSENSSKLAEQRRQRVKELEVQISELKKKVLEQDRLIKMKEKDDKKIKQLNSEIVSMKSAKVKLIKSMRSEEQKFREWRNKREKEILRLKEQDRKLHSQMVKMENMHQKKETVLKRKVEEAAAVNKRLKDALALQKIVQERRTQNNGKSERIQQWVSQEVEVLVSTLEAKKSLDQLIEARAQLTTELAHYRNNPDLSDSAIQVEHITNQIDVHNAHISDLQQKILDSDQDNKSKTRWDTVQSMIDAKCALKHLFELVAEIRSKAFDTEYKLAEQSAAIKEQEKMHLDKQAELENQIKLIENKYNQELNQLIEENQQKVSVFLKHLSAKETTSSDELLNERLKIQSVELEKMTSLQEELEKCKQEIEELKNNKTVQSKPKKKLNNKNVTYVMDDHDIDTSFDVDEENEDDPDWVKTPIHKRAPRRTHRLDITKETKENSLNTTVKRSSDGSTKCNCKTSCKNRFCGCRKLGRSCSDLCKCTNCCNRQDSDQSLMKSETESDESFKKPRVLLEANDHGDIHQPLKYLKSYFK